MSKSLKVLAIFICLCHALLQGKVVKLNQKEGIWQDKKEKQIEFVIFERVNFDFDKVPLKKISKISLYKNNIFILDGNRNEIYVIDKNGKYLYTVGRPGQGPGDIEYGCDFVISADEKIYVLSSFARRIEVFDIKGKPFSSIKLKTPKEWMSAKSLLLNQNKNIIIGSSYQDIVALYIANGDYVKTILNTGDLKMISETRIGINAKLGFLGNEILMFDAFRGIFVKLSLQGDIKAEFSGFSYKVTPEASINDEESRNMKIPKGVSSQLNITSWTNFCIDEFYNIYVIPLGLEEDGYQNLFVFSGNGIFLYKIPLSYFKKNQIINICCDSDHFMFMTRNFDLIKTKISRIE